MSAEVHTERAWPCLHELFDEQARRAPEAVAIRFAGVSTTYGELDRWSDRIARSLVRRGLRSGEPVGVHLRNGAPFAAAVLGTLKAGMVLLPLDTRLPAKRLRAVLDEAHPRLVISEPSLAPRLPLPDGVELLSPDSPPPASDAGPALPPPSSAATAYLMFTSGSTGRPKGALVAHAGVSNHLAWLHAEMPLPPQSAILMKSSHSFDAWILEFFWALSGGHRLVMAESERTADPAYLLDLMREETVAGLVAVPSLLRGMVSREPYRELTALRYVISAGEPLDAALASAILANPNVALYNLYGPTEASIDATYLRVDAEAGDPIPIGRPLPNMAVHVLDEARRPVPPGARGELWIEGVGVCQGYLDAPEETAARFFDRVESLGEGRYFRTGDYGLVRDDGSIVFLGRDDGQVKINGVRVEMAEVEAVLRGHPSVLDCAVAVKVLRDEARGLVAYVVPTGRAVSRPELLTYLRERLPAAMVPTSYTTLEQLPTLASGKRDIAALPVPRDLPRSLPEDYQEARTDMERRLAELWEKMLGVAPIGVYDDFYVLGGNSLLVLDTLVAISEEIHPPIFDHGITEFGNVSQLAALIESESAGGSA